MQQFTTLTARALPLPLANVDTDMIYPSINSNGARQIILERNSDFHGKHGFYNQRYDADGQLRADCVFNDARYRDARILIALDNFACGSSREMAVWALADMGFRCVIAPSFGDIFFSNATMNGLLPVRLPQAIVARALEQVQADATGKLTVDLENLRVTLPDGSQHAFELNEHRRQCLLQGLDEIGFTLKSLSAIERFEALQRQRKPWLQP